MEFLGMRSIGDAQDEGVWAVGALCKAVANALDARFNPVVVRGEVTGFSRASSGHCYFSLKDETGQLRCAMFKRAASMLDFIPRDGELVDVRARLTVYEPRGDLQLVVEGMRRAGQGALFEQFLKVKAKLEAQGLFAAERKRPLPIFPRGIGLVTSLGAAALHDVATALQRRVPHVPVVFAPAAVQGEGAPQELIRALSELYTASNQPQHYPPIDVILLVRGGGSVEDLFAFNDEQLALAIGQSPVPVVSGVGHETDFTIADFVADLRAPTPTAAVELVCEPTQRWLDMLTQLEEHASEAITRQMDTQAQRLDRIVERLGRPSAMVARRQVQLAPLQQQFAYATKELLRQKKDTWAQAVRVFSEATIQPLRLNKDKTGNLGLRLELLDPKLVLGRGYAWLTDSHGSAVGSVKQLKSGQRVSATLVDGTVDLSVVQTPPN